MPTRDDSELPGRKGPSTQIFGVLGTKINPIIPFIPKYWDLKPHFWRTGFTLTGNGHAQKRLLCGYNGDLKLAPKASTLHTLGVI